MGSRKNLGLAALLHHGLDARVGVNGHTPRLGEPFPTGAKHEAGYGDLIGFQECRRQSQVRTRLTAGESGIRYLTF